MSTRVASSPTVCKTVPHHRAPGHKFPSFGKAGLNLVGGLPPSAAKKVELVAEHPAGVLGTDAREPGRLVACTNVRIPYWRIRSSLAVSGFSTPANTFIPKFT
jgi:hypothetical protein